MAIHMNTTKALLDRALADKAASRLKARALAWPDKIKIIERLRDATKIARQGMKEVRPSRSVR